MSDQSLPIIHVSGAHYEMGRQHGEQVLALRPAVLASIAARQAQLQRDDAGSGFTALVDDTIRLLERVDPAIVAQIHGIADGLQLPREQLLRYNLVPFLRDALTTRRRLDEGCTTWAAAPSASADHGPFLVKNRDYTPEHVPLQLIVRAAPQSGYRYTFLTSAGSPGVFVCGFNEAGLAIVDTHVPSLDVGPGLPHYALAMHALEQCHTVRSALDYLQTAPRLGRNNFLLADVTGDIAAFEIGHRHYAILEASDGILVNTNHFNSPQMRPFFVDTEPPGLRGNSLHRYARVSGALQEARGHINVLLAKNLMACHAGLLDSICRHPSPDSETSTIAAAIFLPQHRELHLCFGQPCQAAYHTFSYP